MSDMGDFHLRVAHEMGQLQEQLEARDKLIRKLKAENAELNTRIDQLKEAIKLHVACEHILEDRAEAAEAKLLAVEGLPRYNMPAYLDHAVPAEHGGWIKYSELRAALKGEHYGT